MLQRRRGFRALVLCLATVAILSAFPSPASAAPTTTAMEVRLVELANAERARAGLGPLRVDVRLVASARPWAQRMARDGELSHDPNLSSGVPGDAEAWAENVGRSSGEDAAEAVHEAFMSSSRHRANILSSRYTDLGVGVAVGHGSTWVTQRFTAGAPARVATGEVEGTAATADRVFAGGADHAVIVRDDAFPDALAAGPLAAGRGPILFTPPGPALYPKVRRTLERVVDRGGTVWIVGGNAAVSEEVAREVAQAGWQVRRLAGDHRVATAEAVARALAGNGTASTVLLATGADWPDAAAGGAYGARHGAPVLLAHRDTLPDETRRALRDLDPQRVVALGGPAVLSDAVLREAGATRVAGADRQETAAAIAERLWNRTSAADAPRWIATPAGGESWAWALGAAPVSARNDAPVLLAADPLAGGLRTYLQRLGYSGDRSAELIVHGPVDAGARSDLRRLLNAG